MQMQQEQATRLSCSQKSLETFLQQVSHLQNQFSISTQISMLELLLMALIFSLVQCQVASFQTYEAHFAMPALVSPHSPPLCQFSSPARALCDVAHCATQELLAPQLHLSSSPLSFQAQCQCDAMHFAMLEQLALQFRPSFLLQPRECRKLCLEVSSTISTHFATLELQILVPHPPYLLHETSSMLLLQVLATLLEHFQMWKTQSTPASILCAKQDQTIPPPLSLLPSQES
mmetsp:Transcript_8276/g.14985  ORF Transcript_8276/g.14985 Transcript_8276/m.14985 type:complete len:231 (+) Transcript_8276:506-1198(+)